jgi:GDP-4-dehydro-6-deoxy-D-mannose reductase
MRALITGISGFVGSHLAEYLEGAGVKVFGIARAPAASAAGVVFAGDILDVASLHEAVKQSKPAQVFHCAGVLSGADAKVLYETNVIGTSNLFAALSAANIQPIVVISGSSAVYGRPPSLPVTEDQPYAPLSDYAASKAAQEVVALSHFLSTGWPVIRVRAFNLIGPRLSTSLAASSLAKQVAAAERGRSDPIRVGNLAARRDYTDVRDAVRAYAMLAERGKAGEIYNVCSGATHSTSEVLERLIEQTGKKLITESDQSLFKGSDVETQCGSFERIRLATGWQPVIPFEQSLRDLLDDWRSRNGEGKNP